MNNPRPPHHHHQSFPLKSCLSVQPCGKYQRLAVLLAERAEVACRRRERRQRSWWRHEQPSVAAALVTARHHSAGRVVEEVVTRQEGSEEVMLEEYDAPRRGSALPCVEPATLRVRHVRLNHREDVRTEKCNVAQSRISDRRVVSR